MTTRAEEEGIADLKWAGGEKTLTKRCNMFKSFLDEIKKWGK